LHGGELGLRARDRHGEQRHDGEPGQGDGHSSSYIDRPPGLPFAVTGGPPWRIAGLCPPD
ncbi:MAG: hypothetical protein ABI629_23230, partial [bacterium]